MSFAMPHILRSTLWLSFFAVILGSWWMMYMMSMDMGLDLLGRPNMMAQKMRMMEVLEKQLRPTVRARQILAR